MKFIIKLFMLIVVVAAVVIGAATFYLDTIAKKAIEFGIDVRDHPYFRDLLCRSPPQP